MFRSSYQQRAKICFFQQQQQNKIKQKFQFLSDNISLETQATLTNASLNIRVYDLSSSPKYSCSESQQEEEQKLNKSNESS